VQFTAKCRNWKELSGTQVVLVPIRYFKAYIDMDIPSQAMLILADFKVKVLSLGLLPRREAGFFKGRGLRGKLHKAWVGRARE
jgi:hypothetical protein